MIVRNMIFTFITSLFLPACTGDPCRGFDCMRSYIDKPEPAYKWADTGVRLRDEGWTGYLLNFTSQTWLEPGLVTRSEWWHQLLIIVPDNIRVLDTAALWVEYGDNTKADNGSITPGRFNVQFMADISVAQGMVSALVYQVPNQPVVFSEDVEQKERIENAMIAFTWWHFLHDPDQKAEYLLRLPMVKSAVKAMDTVTNFLTDDTAPAEIQGLGLNPTKFITGGASKRGWTVWNLATVDSRVIAIFPAIMDLLNYNKNMKNQFASYGGWSWTLSDFWVLNTTAYTDSQQMADMQAILDVYEYPERMLIPKLLILATNDEFFLPTNTRNWWKDLPDEQELNRLLMVPNQDHITFWGLQAKSQTINGWINKILKYSSGLTSSDCRSDRFKNLNLPRFNWTHESGKIIVNSEQNPSEVKLWSAESCNARRQDWRY